MYVALCPGDIKTNCSDVRNNVVSQKQQLHTMCKQRCRMLRNRFMGTYKGIVEGLEEVWSFKSVCHTGCDCSLLRVRNIFQTSDNADDLEHCYSMNTRTSVMTTLPSLVTISENDVYVRV
jgi:hypothetical protein